MLPFKKKQSYTINCKQDLIMWINRRCYKCCNMKTSRIYFAWYSRKFLKVPYLFIINFKIFTNRSFVYKLYGTQFLNKLVTIMGTNICKIRASTKDFFRNSQIVPIANRSYAYQFVPIFRSKSFLLKELILLAESSFK